MPITTNWNISWLNQNASRSFPIANDTTKTDITGSFQLPDDLLVGLYLSIPLTLSINPSNFYLKTVRVTASSVSLEIGYQGSSGAETVATAAILRETHTFGRPYALRGAGDFIDAGGHVVIGLFDGLDLQPPGAWTFSLTGSRLEPDAVRPQLRGVSSLQVSNGLNASSALVGDIVLRPGRNMRITPILAAGEDPILQFDAIDGEGLNEECVCADGSTNTAPIRTISRVRPGPDGNLQLNGSDCVEIEPIANGLRIRNTCSEPCCGCEQLDVITAALERFGQQATTLENFLTSLEASVTQMNQSVLASKLNDRGCSTC